MEHNGSYGRLYIDKHGVLRIVMGECPKNIVIGMNVLDMTIWDIIITPELDSIFAGFGGLDRKRHKVNWI